MEIINFSSWLHWLLIILAGLFLGQCLNIIIYNMPKMIYRQWQQEVDYFKKNITMIEIDKIENSFLSNGCCLPCSKSIPIKYTIALSDWLYLRRCRICNKRIIRDHIIIILITIMLPVIIINFSDHLFRLGALILICSLIVLAFIDIDTQILPDNITLPLLWCGLIFNLNGFLISLNSAVLGAVCGYLSLWSLYWIFKLLTTKEGMGYGDFKLLAALGAWFGMEAIPVLMSFSAFVAILTYLTTGLFKKPGNRLMAFGPFLALAGIGYFFCLTLA